VRQGSRKRSSARDEARWTALADLILIIAREIQFRGYEDPDAVALSPSEGMVMRYLQHRPEAAPGQIAASTGLQKTNLSTVLRRLEHKGLVERGQQADDGRGVIVHLTARGKDNYALVRHEWATAVAQAAGGQTERLDAALALLRAVEAGLVADRLTASGQHPYPETVPSAPSRVRT
jgi:DNA-binding MarR family transcriptional regulator